MSIALLSAGNVLTFLPIIFHEQCDSFLCKHPWPHNAYTGSSQHSGAFIPRMRTPDKTASPGITISTSCLDNQTSTRHVLVIVKVQHKARHTWCHNQLIIRCFSKIVMVGGVGDIFLTAVSATLKTPIRKFCITSMGHWPSTWRKWPVASLRVRSACLEWISQR